MTEKRKLELAIDGVERNIALECQQIAQNELYTYETLESLLKEYHLLIAKYREAIKD